MCMCVFDLNKGKIGDPDGNVVLVHVEREEDGRRKLALIIIVSTMENVYLQKPFCRLIFPPPLWAFTQSN